MAFSGGITKQLSAHRAVDGVLTFNGSIGSSANRKLSLDGVLSFAGQLGTARTLSQAVGGVLSFAGDLTTISGKLDVAGMLSFLGAVALKKNGVPVGVVKAIAINLGKFKELSVNTIRRWIRL